jgi:type VI secretion system protein ImpH
MDDQKRASSNSLVANLLNRPFEFDFFQAVRRIECANSALPRVGHSRRPQDDPVRFCQNVSLAFAPSALAAYHEATDQNPNRMIVNFLVTQSQGQNACDFS